MKLNAPMISGKVLFFSTIGTVVLTPLTVFVIGLKDHHSVAENGIYSVLVLWSIMMTFLTVALYNGVSIQDDFGFRLRSKFVESKKKSDSSTVPDVGIEIPDIGDDLLGIIAAIVLWLLITVAFIFLVIFFQAIILMIVFWMALMFYWIIIRAFRLVFAKSSYCRGNLFRSFQTSVIYSTMYSVWFFLVFFIVERLNP